MFTVLTINIPISDTNHDTNMYNIIFSLAFKSNLPTTIFCIVYHNNNNWLNIIFCHNFTKIKTKSWFSFFNQHYQFILVISV